MFDKGARQWLQRLLGPGVLFDEPMARHTSLRIGGPADALVYPENEAQLKALLQWMRQTQTPYMVLGLTCPSAEELEDWSVHYHRRRQESEANDD